MRAVAVLLLVLVLVPVVGAATRPADQWLAQRMTLRLSDFPPGWRAEGSGDFDESKNCKVRARGVGPTGKARSAFAKGEPPLVRSRPPPVGWTRWR